MADKDIIERIDVELKQPYTTVDDLRDLLKEAKKEIEMLRSLAGQARVGDSFSEVTKDMRHRTGER